jgi:antitoxin CcdA
MIAKLLSAHNMCALGANVEHRIFNPKAVKKPTNLSINSDLLGPAKALKINLSQSLEERLFQVILDKKKQDWREEDREAIEAYNRRTEKNAFSVMASGVFNGTV